MQVEKVAEKLALLSDPNLPEKFADQNNNAGCIENSLVNRDGPITSTSKKIAKFADRGENRSLISFKPISNGGPGGQYAKEKAGAPGASLLKQTLEKSLAKNLDNREGGAGFARESREGLPSKEFCGVSFKPTLNQHKY